MTPGKRIVQVSVVGFWLFVTSVWIYVFVTYSSQFLLALFSSTAFIGAQYLYGGIEWVAVRAAADSRASGSR